MFKLHYFSLLIFLILAPVQSFSQNHSYVIERGDQLSIEVMEHPEFNRANIIVLPDGYIQYPALGSIRVAGLSSEQLADSIGNALSGLYVVNPIVTVYVNKIQNQAVNVIGAVNRPGRIQIYEPTSLATVLALAGGVKNVRTVKKLIVLRQDGTTLELNIRKMIYNGEFTENNLPLIYPNENIVVIERTVEWAKLSFFFTVAYTALRVVELALRL